MTKSNKPTLKESVLTSTNKTYDLPNNANSTKPSYRIGTPEGDEMECHVAYCRARKGSRAAACKACKLNKRKCLHNGRTDFNVAKYCRDNQLPKKVNQMINARLRGYRKTPHALSTKKGATSSRRQRRQKAAAIAAANEPMVKTSKKW